MKYSAVIVALIARVEGTESACALSGVSGVTCGPSDEALFATGMNGDEDLGEDITMKGNKFHFVQGPGGGMNGDEDLGETVTINGQKLSFNQQPTDEKSKPFATGMNGDEDLGEDITMKGEKFHFSQESLIQLNKNEKNPWAPLPSNKL